MTFFGHIKFFNHDVLLRRLPYHQKPPASAIARTELMPSAERRDSVSEVPPDFMAAGFTVQGDGCTSQLSNMASNFSHWRALAC
jgi:hypothetical protein